MQVSVCPFHPTTTFCSEIQASLLTYFRDLTPLALKFGKSPLCNIITLYLIATLKLMNNLGQIVSFLPRLTITVQQCGFRDSDSSVRAAFCTSFKIIIREHVGKGGIQSLLLTRYVYLCEQKLTVVSKEGGSSPFPCCPENCNCL